MRLCRRPANWCAPRRLGGLLALFWCAVGVWIMPSGQADAADGDRVALVIGNANYQHLEQLKNPTNDARALAAKLKSVGFAVTLLENLDRRGMVWSVSDWLRTTRANQTALIYYAGHGIEVAGRNYLLPVDMPLLNMGEENLIRSEAISLDDLLADVNAAPARRGIVILDACRNNPYLEVAQAALSKAGDARQVSRGLARISDLGQQQIAQVEVKTYGTIIAYAAAPGATAADGKGRNSPYTAALLRHLEKPGLEVGRMFREVAGGVIEETKGVQKPEYLVKLTNEFYFLRPEPNECDRLAVAPFNQVGLPGIEFDAINAKEAIPACLKAVQAASDNPRFLHNAGRAYDAAGDYKNAVAYYRKSAEADFVPAINNYGVMHINGQGVEQDFRKGVALLKRAYKRGNKHARIAMQATDFSVLFEVQEFAKVQRALAATGDYEGVIDGDFGSGSKAALKAYQTRNKLARKGLTLETLDALSLVSIIPKYSVN